METKPSRPTTSRTTHQVLSGSCAVFSTAPIQATKCANAAKSKINITSTSRPSNVQDSMPDLIPVTSDPVMTKMSLLIARTPVTATNTNPATSPMRLPQNSLTINDLVISTTSRYTPARLSVRDGRDPWSLITQPNVRQPDCCQFLITEFRPKSTGPSTPLVLALRRVFANQPFQECLSDPLDLGPVGVNVVARGVGTQAAWLVAHDLLHHEAFDEAVLAVKQSASEETDLRGMPARLLFKVRHVRLCVRCVAVCGEAHREER